MTDDDTPEHSSYRNEDGRYQPMEHHHSHHKESVKSYTDEELAVLIDHWIDIWDTSKDGYITYYEYRMTPMWHSDDDSNEA